jgi:hypothetical protein
MNSVLKNIPSYVQLCGRPEIRFQKWERAPRAYTTSPKAELIPRDVQKAIQRFMGEGRPKRKSTPRSADNTDCDRQMVGRAFEKESHNLIRREGVRIESSNDGLGDSDFP